MCNIVLSWHKKSTTQLPDTDFFIFNEDIIIVW